MLGSPTGQIQVLREEQVSQPPRPDDVFAELADVRASLSALQDRAAKALEQNRQERERLAQVRQQRAQRAAGQRFVPESVVAQMAVEIESLQRQVAGLSLAMESRGVIEQAKGVIMARDGCDAETAFRTLVTTSQRSNRKLREVAHMVIAWVVESPAK